MLTKFRLAATLLLAAGTAVSAQSLTTDLPNNGSGGVFMDLTANQPLEVTQFDIAYTGTTGSMVDVEVWIRPGSYVGFEGSSFGWTLMQTVSGTRQGASVLSPLTLSLPIELDAGVTTAVYLQALDPSGIRYNGTAAAPPQTTWQNADLTLYSEHSTTASIAFGGSIFTPRTFAGTVHYQPGGPPTPGACCFPDGSCQELLGSECFNQGGRFQGGGSDCATANCPDPGACCFQWGGCDVMLETECDSLIEATFLGENTTCPGTCEVAGACCLADGSCVYLPENDCTTLFNGTWAGAEVNCGEARCATAPVLWNNGPLMTSEGIGCNLADVSELQNQAPINGNTLGFNWNNTTESRLADQFIIPDGEEWNIEEVTLFGYDTGAITVTYTAAYIQIWDGDPRDPASSIVAGDQTTNVLTQADQMSLFRATVLAPFGCDRQIQEITTNFQATLGPGTYWIDRSAAVSGTTTPWMPPVTFANLAGKPNANGLSFFGGAWDERVDTGNGVRQDMPFVLIGTIADACYANCDGSTTEPILTVNDFTCFINEFASAQALPVSEQIVHYANCDGSTTEPVLTVNDFTCFINEFAQGCP